MKEAIQNQNQADDDRLHARRTSSHHHRLADFAERMERVRLAAAVKGPSSSDSGSKLPHSIRSARFVPALVVRRISVFCRNQDAPQREA